MKKEKRPAIIDVSVICMGCEEALYTGAYHPGLIGKLKKRIKESGWIHHPTEGTLCPECAKIYEKNGSLTRRRSFGQQPHA